MTADVINVSPEHAEPRRHAGQVRKEHTHSEDEVRFTVKGSGVFHIHPDNGPVFAVQVESGDLINVPMGTKHWFDLCSDRNIRCIRLFQSVSGWTPTTSKAASTPSVPPSARPQLHGRRPSYPNRSRSPKLLPIAARRVRRKNALQL